MGLLNKLHLYPHHNTTPFHQLTCHHILIKLSSTRQKPLRFYSGAQIGQQHRCKHWRRVSIGVSEGESDAQKMQWSAGGRWQLRDWAFCVLYPDRDGGQQKQVSGVFAGHRWESEGFYAVPSSLAPVLAAEAGLHPWGLRDRYRQELRKQNLHSWPCLCYWHQQLRAARELCLIVLLHHIRPGWG